MTIAILEFSNAMARLFCFTGLLRPSASSAIRPFWWVIGRTALLIGVYYCLSIGLLFYQNKLLKHIKYPLIIVTCHLVVKFVLASVLRIGHEIWTKQQRVLLDLSTWVKRLSVVGLSGGADIAFSQWGQEFITVSLYTMTKSTAIIFILGFALAFKLEEKHWSLIFIVVMISSGLIMFTYKSTQFQLAGFLLVMAASFLSGLRWSLTQAVVQKATLGLHNPIDMVYHVQPWMLAAVLPFAVYFEGTQLYKTSIPFDTPESRQEVYTVIWAVLIGAVMAFCMELAEYLVISFTSSLTFAVAGIFKEICTLVLAVIVNGDEMSFINFMGLLMCLTGIICHVVFKFLKSTSDAKHSTTNGRQTNSSSHPSKGKNSYIPDDSTETSFVEDYEHSKLNGDSQPLLIQDTNNGYAFLKDLSESENEEEEDQVLWKA